MKTAKNNSYGKIVRIMDRLNIGGPAIHAILLSRHFSDSGQASEWNTLLIIGQESENEASMLPEALKSGIHPYCIPSLGREINPMRDLATLWALYRAIRRERPLVVHTHKSKAGTLGR